MARYEKTLYPATAQPLLLQQAIPRAVFSQCTSPIPTPLTMMMSPIGNMEPTLHRIGSRDLTVVVRTPIAHEALPTEATNVIGVDLKAAAAAATAGGLSLTYDLGTEEATRLIAAKINSRKAKQVSERGLTRLLRARYVRMSGRETITGTLLQWH